MDLSELDDVFKNHLNDKYGGLRSIKKHSFTNPLSNPGSQDLSIKVDFNILKHIALENGAEVYGPVDQSYFLKKLGIKARINNLIKNNPSHKEQLNSQMNRLVDNVQMGKLFKVFVISSKNIIKSVGF